MTREPGWYWTNDGDEWEPARWSEKGWEPAMSASLNYFSDESMGKIGPRIAEPVALTSTGEAPSNETKEN